MTLPEASKCMECHSTIKQDSPAIQKLAAYAKTDREIDWVRIYQIPAYVIFSHKTHIDSGATCNDCHGPVAQRDRLFRETDLSMGGCMNCHREKKVSINCTTCHDQLR